MSRKPGYAKFSAEMKPATDHGDNAISVSGCVLGKPIDLAYAIGAMIRRTSNDPENLIHFLALICTSTLMPHSEEDEECQKIDLSALGGVPGIEDLLKEIFDRE